MNDDNNLTEEKNSESLNEIINMEKNRNIHSMPHQNASTINNSSLDKALKKKDIKSTLSPSNSIGSSNLSTNNSSDINIENISDKSEGKTIINSGIATVASKLNKNPWLWIVIISSATFLFLLIIIIGFLLKNSDGLNYASGNYFDSEEYRKIYSTVDNVVNEYRSKYGITVDKYLIISALTAYQGNEKYVDTTDTSTYDNIEVEDEFTGTKNITQMENYAELLAKYQIKTITNCDFNSNTMRQIASNDDSNTIFNFWTSATSKEKNYDCSGTDSNKIYSLSTDEGRIDDNNSGSTFYWNLIDENFLKEYYSIYFADLSDELYESTAAETVSYIYLYADSLKALDTTSTSQNSVNGMAFWWPIGSLDKSYDDGNLMAVGNPVPISDSDIKIVNDSLYIYLDSDTNIIAAKDGKVVEIVTPDDSEYDINGYGSYVKIEHPDGMYTMYARLDTINVEINQDVKQGQIIGNIYGSNTTERKYLIFEIRTGPNSSDKVDPTEYINKDNPRPKTVEFSLTTTSLTEQEFISLMEQYCTKSGNQNFCTNFVNNGNAKNVYNYSKKYGVNPELVVVTAGTEMGWKKCDGLYNFWGIGISNGKGCSAGPKLTSLEAGIESYAKTINSYLEGGSRANMITSRYNERESSGCDAAGHGLPGTLAGMQSIYSWIGDYRYNPGSSGRGGCYYLDIMYGNGYCSKRSTCSSPYSNCSADSKTTVCEQNDYTAWQLTGKIKLRNSIFNL